MNCYLNIAAFGFPIFLVGFLLILFDKGEGTNFYNAGFTDGFESEAEDHVNDMVRVFAQRAEATELAAKHSKRFDAVWAIVKDETSELGTRIKEILK